MKLFRNMDVRERATAMAQVLLVVAGSTQKDNCFKSSLKPDCESIFDDFSHLSVEAAL